MYLIVFKIHIINKTGKSIKHFRLKETHITTSHMTSFSNHIHMVQNIKP